MWTLKPNFSMMSLTFCEKPLMYACRFWAKLLGSLSSVGKSNDHTL